MKAALLPLAAAFVLPTALAQLQNPVNPVVPPVSPAPSQINTQIINTLQQRQIQSYLSQPGIFQPQLIYQQPIYTPQQITVRPAK